jgi:methylglutaconyl-CoA hydratase
MSDRAIEVERQGPVTWVWLSRPEVHNAFDAAMIEELTSVYLNLERDAEVRVIVLGARGKSFSAGAQVQWMKEQGTASEEENASDARRLAQLFQTIAESPKPTLARVQGAALGGGVGLVASCDIAIGTTDAFFATSEVRLGLIPATIGPYVIRAIGERQARRLFQTGERIDAATAERIGLLHEAVAPEQLEEHIRVVIDALLAGAPLAQREAKELIEAIANRPITVELMEDTARRIAARRAHPEAAEGLSAFLEKRPAAWAPRSSR